jgi:protein-tyrosine-phosphatase
MKTALYTREDMKKPTARRKHKITFACDENTCRSPMAKVVLENLTMQREIHDIVVDSAALERPGSIADARSRMAIEERYGNDLLKDHVAKPIDVESLGRLVVVMTKAQKDKLVFKLGKLGNGTPVLTVSQLIMPSMEPGQRDDFGRDITDPHEGSLEDYRFCLSMLERYISEGQDRILKIARRGLYAGRLRKDGPKACPRCDSPRVVPVGYGLPTLEYQAEHAWYSLIGRDPPSTFGGCCIGIPGQPNWHCFNCGHEWATRHPADHKLRKEETGKGV